MAPPRGPRPRPEPTLAARVREALGCPWSEAREHIARGRVSVDGEVTTDPAARVAPGASVAVGPRVPTAPTGALERWRLAHLDAQVAVVDKAPGVNTVPFEDGERGTLVDLLATQLHRWGLAPPRAPLFVVHRLDRETTGLLVFGRTWLAKRHLSGLFRRHDLEREYLCLVHGRFPAARSVTTRLLDDRGDGLRGSAGPRDRPTEGRVSTSHFRPLHALQGATLVGCRLETGRQHQLRIHLSELGHPILGERVYIREFRGPALPAPRVLLHAASLGFQHPTEPRVLRLESALPEDFLAAAEALGGLPEALRSPPRR
ncbi:MAG: RluA family pseudouridine synthase [Deltaproteobacteria bacterium]|nr:RluA family pseudouridine synthase [Deltaproteobacteria bacterium]